jgi:hypothetical protein
MHKALDVNLEPNLSKFRGSDSIINSVLVPEK